MMNGSKSFDNDMTLSTVALIIKGKYDYVPLHITSLRARRAQSMLKDVPLRTKRALLLYNVYGDSTLLVLNGTPLNSDSALLVLNETPLNSDSALLALN